MPGLEKLKTPLLALLMVIAGCTAQPLKPSVTLARLPQVPPDVRVPEVCLPTCLTAWEKEQDVLLDMLTNSAQP